MPQSKGTVLKNANGFKNGIKVATAAELEEASDDEEEDDDEVQDWKLDTSDEAVAQRRLEELDLITRVEKIMNGGLGDKAKGKRMPLLGLRVALLFLDRMLLAIGLMEVF
jgi:hypothetical protein